jgi:hypothetical protein
MDEIEITRTHVAMVLEGLSINPDGANKPSFNNELQRVIEKFAALPAAGFNLLAAGQRLGLASGDPVVKSCVARLHLQLHAPELFHEMIDTQALRVASRWVLIGSEALNNETPNFGSHLTEKERHRLLTVIDNGMIMDGAVGLHRQKYTTSRTNGTTDIFQVDKRTSDETVVGRQTNVQRSLDGLTTRMRFTDNPVAFTKQMLRDNYRTGISMGRYTLWEIQKLERATFLTIASDVCQRPPSGSKMPTISFSRLAWTNCLTICRKSTLRSAARS